MIHIPHLETDITQACQLSCVACNHHVPLWRTHPGGPWHATPQQVEEDLSHFVKVCHADVWGALGGEPTLNPKLVDILKVVRASGVANTMEVWSNGLTLHRMPAPFWREFDKLVLSVYEGKHNATTLDWVAKKCQDEGVELRIIDERANPNFKTLLEQVPTAGMASRIKFAGCFFRHFSRVLNYGHFFTCCVAPHMPLLIQGQPFGTDGIAVKDITEDALLAYLMRPEPLGCCDICAGRDTAVNITWHEERDRVRWLDASAGRSSGR